MNPKIDYFLFCENVIVGDRGRYTFANVFDEVFVIDLPAAVKSLSVAIKAGLPGVKAGDKLKFDLKITDPNKKVLTKSTIQNFVVPDKEFEGVTLNIDASFLPVNVLGKYKFDLLINDKIVHTRNLIIKKAPEGVVA